MFIMNGQITEFIKQHFRHFNSAALIDAAEGYKGHVEGGGKMMITLAGAMSPAGYMPLLGRAVV